MAYFDFALGVAIGVQSAYGTINTTIRDLTGALATANGIVLGDADAGVGQSGITFDQERIEKALAPVTASFTKQAPSFIRIDPVLEIAVPFGGARNAASNPVVDADMDLATHWPGMFGLLRGSWGAGAAWGGGVGHQWLPASLVPFTAKIWVGGTSGDAFCTSYVLQDCFADLDIDFTPGGIAVATFKIGGTRALRTGAVTIPTFNYGTQASVSAPTVDSAAFTWGPSRGFIDLKLSVVNQIQEFADSNVVGGISKRQASREISIAGTIYSDSADQDYEDTRLEATTAPTDDATFTIGDAATATNPVNAYFLSLNNLNVTKNSPEKVGPLLARKIEASCTGPTANSEAELRWI